MSIHDRALPPPPSAGSADRRWPAVSSETELPDFISFLKLHQRALFGEAMSIFIPALPNGLPASFVSNHVGKHYLTGAVIQMNRLGPKAVSGVFGVKFAAHLDRKHPPYLVNLEPDSSSRYSAPSQHLLQHNLAVSPQWQALLAAWESRAAAVQPPPSLAPAVRRRGSRPRPGPQLTAVAAWPHHPPPPSPAGAHPGYAPAPSPPRAALTPGVAQYFAPGPPSQPSDAATALQHAAASAVVAHFMHQLSPSAQPASISPPASAATAARAPSPTVSHVSSPDRPPLPPSGCGSPA